MTNHLKKLLSVGQPTILISVKRLGLTQAFINFNHSRIGACCILGLSKIVFKSQMEHFSLQVLDTVSTLIIERFVNSWWSLFEIRCRVKLLRAYEADYVFRTGNSTSSALFPGNKYCVINMLGKKVGVVD